VTGFIAFAGAVVFLLPFSAQKTHVKPQNHLTLLQTATSAWHFSSTQPDILDIDRKKETAPETRQGANLLKIR
jgi:hypothetical protein